MPKVRCTCTFCGSVFERYASLIKNENSVFCNKTCYSKYQKTLVGELNQNYGNKWTNEQKKVAKNRSVEWLDENREAWLEINRNRTWTEEGKQNIGKSAKARLTGITKLPLSEEQKRQIGIKSSEKFTNEFKVKYRKTMEDRGYWIPLDKRDPYAVYFKESDWIDRMFDNPLVEGYNLTSDIGVFNMKTNTKGAVRDHKFGRKNGFALKVFPQLLRHPANCQIISHADNVSKAQNNKLITDDCVITLDELFNLILEYRGEWKEQEACINLITEYKQGKRYE